VAADLVKSQRTTGVIPVFELERARKRMVELCAELTSGTTQTFPVATDPSACTYCNYRISCIARPYPEEVRFAR
jgi:CRISPR/Cas system-associated exonuclease Cas4 (RecB family)